MLRKGNVEDRIAAMGEKKVGVATRLFIDGRQIGSNADYMDYYPSTDVAIADRRFTRPKDTKLTALSSRTCPDGPIRSQFRP